MIKFIEIGRAILRKYNSKGQLAKGNEEGTYCYSLDDYPDLTSINIDKIVDFGETEIKMMGGREIGTAINTSDTTYITFESYHSVRDRINNIIKG